MPLTGGQTPTVVAVAGRPIPPLSERATATRHLVSPRYFSTLGIPLRAGRDFDERDNTRVPHVVIINETFARRHFPGEDPIGRTLVTGMAQRPSQVVGVVADIRGENLNTPPEPEYFLPVLQRPEALTNVLVRSHLPPAAVAPLVREALRTIDPDLPLLQPDALTTRIAQTVANRKLALMLLAAFAALALVLASLGVYSVMAHLVAFRTSEIGLRMALGASPNAVMRMVLGHGRASHARRHRVRHRRCARRLAADAAGAVRSRSGGAARLHRAVGHVAARRRVRLVLPGATRDAGSIR